MNRRRHRLPGPKWPNLAWLALLTGVFVGSPGCDGSSGYRELDLDRITTYSARPLSDVLGASVVAGKVNYELIEGKYRSALDHFLQLAEAEGPTSTPALFPFSSHRSAYYINVYNAMVLRCWLDHGAAEATADTTLDPAWFDEAVYTVDRQAVSINQVRDLVRQQGDPRLMLALCGGTVSEPLLGNQAFAADQDAFENDLNTYLLRLFAEPATFIIGQQGNVSAPYWMGRYAERAGGRGELVALIERYVLENHRSKLELIRAARAGNVQFREQDLRINLALRRDAASR